MQVPKYTLSTCTCPSIWLQQVKITSAITHCGIFIGIVTINAYFCIAGLGTAAGKLFSQQKNNHIKSWMELLSGTLPANSKLLSGTLWPIASYCPDPFRPITSYCPEPFWPITSCSRTCYWKEPEKEKFKFEKLSPTPSKPPLVRTQKCQSFVQKLGIKVKNVLLLNKI